MSVVKAKIQTVGDMSRLICTAIANKRPIRAIYKELPRLFCPHRLGRNRLGQPRVLCYQSGGESDSGLGLGPIGSPENWRCVVFEKLRRVELLRGVVEDRTEPLSAGHLCRRRGTLKISRSATRRRDMERSRRSGVEPGAFSR